MRVLVVGAGAREHALAWACRRSDLVGDVLCAPGNAGTGSIALNVPFAADDVDGLVGVARDSACDLVVIGPDAAVAAGLADACAAAGIAVFGPTRAAGRIEASKAFAKEVMREAGIPTAAWVDADASTRERALRFIVEHEGRCAVKADGLALGKGVTVCGSVDEAVTALDECLVTQRFGAAGARVVVEERLEGREVSVFALTDGERIRLLPPACDYKRAEDGDRGPNTGGMGAYAPPSWLDAEALLEETAERVLQPCVDVLRRRGTPYRGCLYAGLVMTADGLRVLEFNARFGDPETQVVLPLLDEDAVELMLACARGGLEAGRARIAEQFAVGVVAVAPGYPGPVETGGEIGGLDDLDDGVLCFHGGTRRGDDGRLLTAGGRVLTVVGRAETLAGARECAYANVDRVSFPGMRRRGDIAATAGIDMEVRR